VADDRSRAEAALVLACADGDPDAWVRFVDGHGPLIAALARRLLARRTGQAGDADVDEIVSRVFLALLRGERRLLRRYRPEFRLSTYLGVICRTEVGKHLRRRRPASLEAAAGEEGVEGPADPAAETPAAALERRERDAAIASLRPALERLQPRDRLLLTLKFVDGLDYARIAEVLRVRRDSVGQLLHRAKQRLALLVPELRRWVDPSAGSGQGSRERSEDVRGP
jgi:RNA polymerase sigma factor (sigma-70 family)